MARDADPGAVTVVVPTRDRPRHLRTAMWSLSEQQGDSPRVVVVDDGSLRPVEARRPVRVVRHELPRGVAAARNRGLEEVATQWVAFLDDDDVFLPNHLSSLAAVISSAERNGRTIDIAYAACWVTDAAYVVKHLIPAHPPGDVERALHGGNVLPTPSCVIVRTEVVRALGGFDRRLATSADWDLWLRVVRRGGGAAASFAPGVLYTQHGGNMHRDADDTLAELAEMQLRYGAAAHERGVTMPDAGFAAYLAGTLKTAGHRRAAAAWYLRSFRVRRNAGDIVRGAAAIAGVRPSERLRQRPQVEPALDDWMRRLRAESAAANP